MERKTVVAQLAEEVLTEFNSLHDARGRFTSAAGVGVRDFDPKMAQGLRAGAWLRDLCNRVQETYLYAGPAREE